ncbi:hypothetical protein DFH07DRAFT_719626, partial [Mycena maculata]
TNFPTPGLQFLSAWIHFMGVTILTFFLSRRVSTENLTSRQGWERITWPRLCILLVLLDSYLFIWSAGLLIFGVGMQTNHTSCTAGIYLCILFYTTSKILIYAFLTEKVYIVWGNGDKRLRSPVYLVCAGTIALYVAIIVLLIFQRIAEFRPGDDACEIGLRPTASLSLVAYDLYINLLLTSLFLWRILRLKISSPSLRRAAIRTLVASLAALTTSTVNMVVLTVLKGREFGWLCLGSCGSDVILNAVVLFWVTTTVSTPSGQHESASTGPPSPDTPAA